MTSRDYEKISASLRRRVEELPEIPQAGRSGESFLISEQQYSRGMRNAVQAVIIGMADMLEDDNKRFDRGAFFVACGLDGAGAYHR